MGSALRCNFPPRHRTLTYDDQGIAAPPALTYNGERVNEAVSDRILDADGDYVNVQLYAGDGLVHCPVTVQFDLGTDRATLQRLLRKVAADADPIFDHVDRSRSAVEDVTTAEIATRAQKSGFQESA